MPIRPYPQDTPDRETTWRRGRIRTRTGERATGFHYIVDFEPFGTELAFSIAEYDIDAVVHCMWRNESAIWWITQ